MAAGPARRASCIRTRQPRAMSWWPCVARPGNTAAYIWASGWTPAARGRPSSSDAAALPPSIFEGGVRARAKLFEQTQQPPEKTPPLLQRGVNSGACAAPPTRAAGSRASLAMRGPGSTKSCAALFEQKQRDSALEAMGAPPSPDRKSVV